MTLPVVAFVCTHNSCRSQIAEALGLRLAADVFVSCSAGTEPKSAVNPDAVRVLKQLTGLDMTASQHPKLLSDLPPADVVVTMGCGVRCPLLPCRYREDWGLPDPTGEPDEAFERTISAIREKVLDLRARILSGALPLG